MIFDVFLKTFNFFLMEKKHAIAGDSDILQIRKRQLFHKGIPDLTEVKAISGINFQVLLEIFNEFDPVSTKKLKDNSSKYEFLTRTVIFKLPLQKTKQAIADLISLEFSLWFKHAYNKFDKKEELVDAVIKFKDRHLKTDPFEKFRKVN